jgi:phospholipase/carboxylesterase
MSHLPCVVVEPDRPARAAVVWLHGLGADGHDFEPVVPELRLPRELAVRFVFPTAPAIPITINGGMRMPAWYDILDLTSIDRRVDERQLLASATAVGLLVEREIERGIDSRRIVLAGFSQLALSYPKPLAGLMALSTYFATAASITTHPANAALPVLVAHGTHDPIVPEALGRRTHDAMLALGHPVEYRSYRMEHGVCGEEIVDISRWLQKVLSASP